MGPFSKNFDFNSRNNKKKKSHERRDYAVVNERAYLVGYVPKNDETKIQEVRGLSHQQDLQIYCKHNYNEACYVRIHKLRQILIMLVV